jgi:hypothetical protein
MTESPRIPKLLWPPAMLLGFAIAYTVNVIEKRWRAPKQRRPQNWRGTAG